MIIQGKQRTKINCSHSEWVEIVFRVPQWSILAQLLFNICLTDPFLVMDDIDIANYADDNISYVTADDINGVIASLANTSSTCLNGLVAIFLKVMLINATC